MSNIPVNVDFSQGGNSVFENVYITCILDAADSTGIGGDGFSGNNLSVPGNLHVTGLSTFVGDVDVNNLLIRKHLDIGVGGTFLNASVETQRIGIGTTMPMSMLHIGIGGTNSTIISEDGRVGIGTSDPFPFSIVEPQGQKLYEGGIGSTTMYAFTRYYWTVPKGVYSISVVCIGGGSGGGNSDADKAGGGGALSYKTTIPVTPGNVHMVDVGSGGEGSTNTTTAENGTAGGKSIFYESDNVTKLCSAESGSGSTGGTERIGTSGGNGGYGGDDAIGGSGYKHWGYGGGGAGGYDGSGGSGGHWLVDGHDGEEGAGSDGSGGGGGGGGIGENGEEEAGCGGGGGVGVF